MEEHGLNHPNCLHILMYKNINATKNVVRRQRGMKGNRASDRGQRKFVMAKEKSKLAAFLIHCRWRWTKDWDIKHLLKVMIREN